MLSKVLKQYWGYDSFLPLQEQAMQCVMDDRDSLVILPTGGGKSLCYQAPALCREGMMIVVSPLIALMKDQIDNAKQCGISAATIHSGMSADSKLTVVRLIERGEIRLLYVAPEQLLTPRSLEFLGRQKLSAIAVDEAHCISAWGHDFRPEYRGLAALRERFPNLSMHAYTATANHQVRDDIVNNLRLREPEIIVGQFFRPNLVYRIARRERLVNQVGNFLDRLRGQSGIIYCISRADTEKLATSLTSMGYSCAAYHAGLSDAERTERQEAFVEDRVDTIIATIAFGMGIDKSNVRFVIHAAMPKSMANYQQESGRAGRDGLEAECWLLYGSEDTLRWRRTFEELSEEARAAGDAALQAMHAYCVSSQCRHRLLVEHFGQHWDRNSCDACDVCLGQLEAVEEPLIIGQKILSCVMRTGERFGATYVAMVLAGSKDRKILQNRHDQLSTYGLLLEFRISSIRDWIEQLIAQGFINRSGEYQQLNVTAPGRELLRGQVVPILMRPAKAKEPIAATATSLLNSWEGVDRELFAVLRAWRFKTSLARNVAAFIIFSDATLRDLARRMPMDLVELRSVHGVGDRKIADFGNTVIELIGNYCRDHQVQPSVGIVPPKTNLAETIEGPDAMQVAFQLFDDKLSVAQVALKINRAEATVHAYLQNYLNARRITDPSNWIAPELFELIKTIARYSGLEKLKPIHDALHGRIDYNDIRTATTILRNQGFQSIDAVPIDFTNL